MARMHRRKGTKARKKKRTTKNRTRTSNKPHVMRKEGYQRRHR